MLGYIKSCPGQAECTEQIGRGRQWYRKYELLEKLKAGVGPPSDSCIGLQTSGGRRGGAKVRATLVQQVRGLIALQRHVYFLHQPCQEQALEKAMDFNRDKAELSDEPHPRIAARTHPRIVPRNPGHLRLDKTKQVMGLQDRELVKKRQEARVRLAGALN